MQVLSYNEIPEHRRIKVVATIAGPGRWIEAARTLRSGVRTMKIKRFLLPTSARRSAGSARPRPDAVILSNKSVEGGIELVAAIDYDEAAFAARSPVREQAAEQAPAAAHRQPR